MTNIANLISKLPEINQSRMVSSGMAVWMVWDGKLSASVMSTMHGYGAVLLVQQDRQALWYCPGDDGLRAVARLSVWARVNSLEMFCQVLPVSFLVGYDMAISISMDAELENQDIIVPEEFEVWVHPKMVDRIKRVPGLSVKAPVGSISGIARADWKILQADQGIDYESTLGWYFIIKPLGKFNDKESIVGWRDFSGAIVEMLQNRNLKYITDIKDGFIYFPLNSINLLRTVCAELFNIVKLAKSGEELMYWPIVMVAVSQEGLSFSEDMPRKVGIDWNRMSPDFPHLRYRDAFLLREDFMVQDTRGGADVTLDSWCTIRQLDDGMGDKYGTIEVNMALALVDSEGEECYYCGQKNHLPEDCPTKGMRELNNSVWQELSNLSNDDFNTAVVNLDSKIDPDRFNASAHKIMDGRDKVTANVLKGVFEINSVVQLRMLSTVWRCRGKEWPSGIRQLSPPEGEFVWDGFKKLEGGDLETAEYLAKQGVAKYPRSYQPQALLGFVYLEMDDVAQAMFHWQEAERLAFTPLQQAYLVYLQARLHEVKGAYKEAIATYRRASMLSHAWLDPAYRQAVCQVKMGFTGQAIDLFLDMLARDPNIFNQVIIDPELERGRVQILGGLWNVWKSAEGQAEEGRTKIDLLIEDMNARFSHDDPYYENGMVELEKLRNKAKVNNYVAYRQLFSGAKGISDHLDNEVRMEIKRINDHVEVLIDRVRAVQREAAWFPFPKLLAEFNRDFNDCVERINWIKTNPIKRAEKFRQANIKIKEIEEKIEILKKRLVTLRIIRDSTLFVLMLGRSFIWFELVGLGLSLIAIPLLLYLTQGIQGSWVIDAVRDQQWGFTKGLVIILSILAFVFAVIKSALTFEKRKQELFDQLEAAMNK